jgi:Xaa-Pro aminopeptidase
MPKRKQPKIRYALSMPNLHLEKLHQAQAMLSQDQLWLIAVRESLEHPEPGLKLIAGLEVTWQSFFLVTPQKAIAIVGRYDAESVPEHWTTLPYDEDPAPLLQREVGQLSPKDILLNYAHEPLCDGLTHGMFLQLQAMLPSAPFVSAETFLSALRSQKTHLEQQCIAQAVQYAENDLLEMAKSLRIGSTERDVADFLHQRLRQAGLEPSWGWVGCPTVHIGPLARPSHAAPTDRALEPGMLLHIDYGVRLAHGYCSDIQRTYYLPKAGEGIPQVLQDTFTACWNAIEAAAQALRPGVQGYLVDAAARHSLTGAGYPEYKHAVGHGLGRATHDGGTLLGPRWARYANEPLGVVQAGEIYTLELGVFVEGYGFIGLEEDVLVTDAGLEWLSNRQNSLYLLEV